MRRKAERWATLAAALLLPALQGQAIAASPGMLQQIGPGEGTLNIVAWEGYAQDDWVKPFEQQTGCHVNRKYAGSSDEMVALMRSGGGNQYDLVSASGDATLRLIYGHNVQPINLALIPAWQHFIPQLKSANFNTVRGVHYGVSYEWGPNVLLWNTQKLQPAPDSWSVIYDKAHAGQITVPDNPIQIADAALYLASKQPDLGITDPYELTEKQMDAVVALLKQQRSLIKKYWALASDEIDLFKNGDVVVGAAWPYQTNTLKAAHVPVADTLPKEGVTGWADTWMLSAKAPHPNCAYRWINWVTTPKVQAQQALYFGETPANTLACKEMDALQAGSCSQYHADAPASYFDQIRFWKTPRTECGNGKDDCLDYSVWQRKWQEIKG
ncbi:MAG TPA: ABC transporter substrate-binding protein [Acetobacteraceae bacterium]|nr:ABC transporter substrate-binding protein [Acetobacteraceae bacterium]